MVKKGKKGKSSAKSSKLTKKEKGKLKTKAAKEWKQKHGHLFKEIARDYSIGNAVQPKRDLGRMVKWPRYIRVARQRAILWKRLKVPPPIHQFSKTIDKNSASNLFALLWKLRPETKQEKVKRLKERAALELKGKDAPKFKRPVVVKYGINDVTRMIEKKAARLVIIAYDVVPIELVIWMPALCKKMGIPWCIVKGKARLGTVVHQKTCACLAITNIHKDQQHKLEQICTSMTMQYLETYEADRKKWGGGLLGYKANARNRLKEKQKQIELKKMGHLLS
jgi:large subunit ribosomal protein L7Ae